MSRLRVPLDCESHCSSLACSAQRETPTRRRHRFAKNWAPGALHKQIIIACLNTVAGVNPAVLIDRAERGLRKMVAVRAEIIAPT